MQIVNLRTAIDQGPDRQVEPLFDGPQRKLVQITLRNGAVLSAHKATSPITIQCLAGVGTLRATEETIQLRPGVLATLDASVVHEITAEPAVTFLLTKFTCESGSL